MDWNVDAMTFYFPVWPQNILFLTMKYMLVSGFDLILK